MECVKLQRIESDYLEVVYLHGKKLFGGTVPPPKKLFGGTVQYTEANFDMPCEQEVLAQLYQSVCKAKAGNLIRNWG